jgi:site-specific recombinase XerD
MLTIYFKDTRALERLNSGPASPYLDSFAESLSSQGYSWATARRHLRAATHLGQWADTVNMRIVDLSEEAIMAFAKHLKMCSCNRSSVDKSSDAIDGARHFLKHLNTLGVFSMKNDQCPQFVPKPLFEGFHRWMREHRGVSERTLEIYSPTVIDALETFGEDPGRYQVESLRRFVFQRLRQCGTGKAKTTVKALRMFLRYLIAQGLCPSGLQEGIPRLANWRLSNLPRYLASADVEKVIDACDLCTPLGRRDKAIILLLARLGLRGGDIAELGLNDIDWMEASIRFSGKGRREVRLPLTQEVGDAILQYLKDGRPAVSDKHVFIRAKAPLRRLGSGSTVSRIVARAIRRAGVDAPSYGAHVLRHSAATAMLRNGVSLNDIAAILRHRSIETTVHYAKVDIALLKEVAQPWPEVDLC